MVNVSVTISLDLTRDKDIVVWLERQENRSAAIRGVLRAHIQGATTMGDLRRLLRRIDGRIEAGVMPSLDCETASTDKHQITSKFTSALEQLSEQSN